MKEQRVKREADMKKLCIILVLLSAMISMTGCNTIRGMGQDVEAVGDGIGDATR